MLGDLGLKNLSRTILRLLKKRRRFHEYSYSQTGFLNIQQPRTTSRTPSAGRQWLSPQGPPGLPG